MDSSRYAENVEATHSSEDCPPDLICRVSRLSSVYFCRRVVHF